MISMTLLTLVPLGFFASTGISNFLDSSLGAQLVTLGVPSIVYALELKLTPAGRYIVPTVSSESMFPGEIMICEIGFPSTTV